MKQDGSLALFHYWNRLRQDRPAPRRTDIEPADIKSLLGDTFILERDMRGEAIFRSIASLSPTSSLQSDLKARATGLAFELIEGRSMFVALATGGISVPVLTLVIAWLVVILFGFSLLAPRNAVAGTALIISAVAVCGAVLLLLELYTPFDGVIQIASDPLLAALGPPAN